MLFFATFFSFPKGLSFVYRVLSIGKRPVDRGCRLLFLEETLVFFWFLLDFFLTKKYSF